jgi:aminoacylase
MRESLMASGDTYTVFYGERMPLWVRVKAKGNTGHGSRFAPIHYSHHTNYLV